MALFKIFRGKKANLPATKKDGYAYYTKDDNKFYIDAVNDSEAIDRKCINPAMTGATASLDGKEGFVPEPKKEDIGKFLWADGTWDTLTPDDDIVQVIGKKIKLDLTNKIYTQEEVDELLAALEHVRMEEIDELPENPASNIIYLFKAGSTHIMYINTSSGWISLGSTDIDLTQYYTKTQIDNKLVDKQDKLIAGDNVTIAADGKTISTTDTKYTGTNPITVTGTTISHANSGVSAGTKGDNDSTAKTPGFGETFNVPGFTVDAMGHMTSAASHTVKIPNAKASASADGLMSKEDKSKLDEITIENYYTKTQADALLDDKQDTISATTPIVKTGNVLSHANSGVTAGTKGDANNQTPSFGESFKALSATVDAKGHLTALGEHTITIPSTEASTSAKGLMSAADKTKLDGITISNYYTKTETDTLLDDKQDTLTAGDNITIASDGTIAVDIDNATATADGLLSKEDKAKLDGITISNYFTKTEVKNKLDDKQDKLTAGTNIEITNSGVINNTLAAATATPLMNGTAAVGASVKYAREDHVHPTDTTRAPLASPAFTGEPTAPTQSDAATNDTQIATTAFVQAAITRRVDMVTLYSKTKTVNIPSGTETVVDMADEVIMAGYYWGNALFSWGNNTSGRRYVKGLRLRGTTEEGMSMEDSRMPVNAGITSMTIPFEVGLKAGDKFRFRVFQNSGVQLSLAINVRAYGMKGGV